MTISPKSKNKMAVGAAPVAEMTSGALHGSNVYNAIRDAISDGSLAGGTRLREIELATRYGVSRTPVREALKKLEIEGLLSDLPGQGLTVAKPTLNEILDAYLIREQLEGLAARLATERALDTELMQLDGLMKQIRAAFDEGDRERTIKLCGVWDDMIFRISNSDRLYRMIQAARASQGQTMRSNIRQPGRLEAALDERSAINAAMQIRDAKAAEVATQDHLHKAREARLAASLEAFDTM